MTPPNIAAHAQLIMAHLQHAVPEVDWRLDGAKVSGDFLAGTMAFVVRDDGGRVELQVRTDVPGAGVDAVMTYISGVRRMLDVLHPPSASASEFDPMEFDA